MNARADDEVCYIDSLDLDLPLALDVREAMDAIAARVGASDSVEEVLDILWEGTALILPRDRIGLSFVEDGGTRVVARAARADYNDLRLKGGYGAGLAGSSLQPILDTGRARIIDDLEAYLEAHPHSDSTARLVEEGVRASLTLPLVVKNRPVGFLFFSNRSRGVFHEEHARILLALLGRIAQTVDKCWTISRLECMTEGFHQTLRFVSHEIKSPLASLITRGETYSGGYLGETDPVAVETIDTMRRIALQLADMVEEYLELSKLENGELQFSAVKDVDLKQEVIAPAMESVDGMRRVWGCDIETDLPDEDIFLDGDPTLLRAAVGNLLSNAIKYGEKETGRVRLSLVRDEGAVVLTVWNKGVGFTEEDKERLFRRFSRLKQRGLDDRRGTGLGLYFTFWIAQKHGGNATARSEHGQWAEFTLRLPLPDRG